MHIGSIIVYARQGLGRQIVAPQDRRNDMKIVVSTDEHFSLVDSLLMALEERGHETQYFGPRPGSPAQDWPVVTSDAVRW